MALKVYRKSPVKIKSRQYTAPKYVEIKEPVDEKRLTLWDVLVGLKYDFVSLLRTSALARIIIPSIFIISGSFILYNQIYPEVKQRAREMTGYYDSNRPELVKGESIQPKETYLSNPGADYFKQLTENAQNQHILQDDPVSKNYKGKFILSIPSLGLNNLPVKSNVESGVEKAYREALNDSLAHFKGTGLPISEVNNNIVVYGHSAGGDYYSRTKDPAAAFSKLSDIKIGAEIKVDIEGKTYTYRVVKTKIVKPDDISIINGTKGKETLTLFTCHPAGNDKSRFVAVARPI